MKSRLLLFLASFFFAPLLNAQPVSSAPQQRTDQVEDRWSYSITPYVWALGVQGSLSQNGNTLGRINLSPADVLSDIKMGAMVVAEARSRTLGFYLDAMYGDLGKSVSQVVGRTDLNANATVRLSIATLAPSLTLYNANGFYLDGLVGARYLWLNAQTSISDPALGISVNQNDTKSITAAVAGVKGRWNLGRSPYFIPFYVDAGGGQSSSFTSQAYLGIGRTFGWGDLSLVVKNVYYQFKSDNVNMNANLFGGAVAATFRF